MICDFAETYNIYDYKALSLSQVMRLLIGLRDNSRVKMKLAGITASQETIFMASILDRLNWLVWVQTEDGQKNINRPESIAKNYFINHDEENVNGFKSADDFEKALKSMRERIKKWQKR